jgi:nucleoside-diphosphate-sugar epimerase
MKQRVLITGASGFVGYHLIEAALAKGLEVFAAVRKTSDVSHLQHLPINYSYTNFNSIESMQKEIEENQYDFIIHGAGVTKAITQDDYNKVNAGYAYNLAKATQQSRGSFKKMVVLSSLAAVGPLADIDGLITENTPLAPVTAYGRSKKLAEEQLATIDLPLIILRPTAVYGPRERDIFILFKSIKRGIEPYIGKQAQQLSFVYVKDLADLAVSAIFASNIHQQTYNITDGRCYDRYQLADLTKALLYKKTLKFHLPLGIVKLMASILETTFSLLKKAPTLNREKLNELTAKNWCCDIEKAKKELGYTPAYDLSKGLTETLAWYKNVGWL